MRVRACACVCGGVFLREWVYASRSAPSTVVMGARVDVVSSFFLCRSAMQCLIACVGTLAESSVTAGAALAEATTASQQQSVSDTFVATVLLSHVVVVSLHLAVL